MTVKEMLDELNERFDESEEKEVVFRTGEYTYNETVDAYFDVRGDLIIVLK